MKPAAALGTVLVLGAALAGCRIDSGPAPAGRPAPLPASDSALAPATVDTLSRVERQSDPPDRPAPATDDTLSPAEPGTHDVPAGRDDAPESPSGIVYHVVKGARFFDILVARIGDREHVVLGETDDMCLDLPDQRDFDGDGNRDALVFRSPCVPGRRGSRPALLRVGRHRLSPLQPVPGASATHRAVERRLERSRRRDPARAAGRARGTGRRYGFRRSAGASAG